MAKQPQKKRTIYNNDIDLFATLSLISDAKTSEDAVKALSEASGLDNEATETTPNEYIERLTEWVMENPDQLKKVFEETENKNLISRFTLLEKRVSKSAPANESTEKGRWYLNRLLDATGLSKNKASASKEFDSVAGQIYNKATIAYDSATNALKVSADDDLLVKMSKNVAKIGIPVAAGTAVASVAAGSSVALGTVAGALAARKIVTKSAIALGKKVAGFSLPESYKSKFSKKLIEGMSNERMPEIDERRIGQLFKLSSTAMLKRHQELSPQVSTSFRLKANQMLEKIANSKAVNLLKEHPRAVGATGFMVAAIAAGMGSESLERTGNWMIDLAKESFENIEHSNLDITDVVENIISPDASHIADINLPDANDVSNDIENIKDSILNSSTAHADELETPHLDEPISPPASGIEADIRDAVNKTVPTGETSTPETSIEPTAGSVDEEASLPENVSEVAENGDIKNTVEYNVVKLPHLTRGLTQLLEDGFKQAGISFDSNITKQAAIEHFLGEIKTINGIQDLDKVVEGQQVSVPTFSGMSNDDLFNHMENNPSPVNAYEGGSYNAEVKQANTVSNHATAGMNATSELENSPGSETPVEQVAIRESSFNVLISDFANSRDPMILSSLAEAVAKGEASIPEQLQAVGITADSIKIAADAGGYHAELLSSKWQSVIDMAQSEISEKQKAKVVSEILSGVNNSPEIEELNSAFSEVNRGAPEEVLSVNLEADTKSLVEIQNELSNITSSNPKIAIESARSIIETANVSGSNIGDIANNEQLSLLNKILENQYDYEKVESLISEYKNHPAPVVNLSEQFDTEGGFDNQKLHEKISNNSESLSDFERNSSAPIKRNTYKV